MDEALGGETHDQLSTQRAQDFVEHMSRAFGGLTDEELLMVNGIDLDDEE